MCVAKIKKVLRSVKRFFVVIKAVANSSGVGQAIKYVPIFLAGYYKIRLRKSKVEKAIKNSTECKMMFGNDYPDKTFYVISIDESWCGLFAIVAHQLAQIAYAIDNGMIPVVDLQNNHTQYLASGYLYKENAWEYFFEQPYPNLQGGEFLLSDIKKARNVVISTFGAHHFGSNYYLGYSRQDNVAKINFLKPYFKKYIRMNAETRFFYEKMHEHLFVGKNRVIGVQCRGSDFIVLKPNGHPVQPQPSAVIEKCDEFIEKYNCDGLYLASEDVDICAKFDKHYGDFLIKSNVKRWSVGDLTQDGGVKANLDLLEKSDKETKILNGRHYLSDIYLLTKCKIFVGGITSASLMLKLMPTDFECEYYFNLGSYDNKDGCAKNEKQEVPVVI